MGCWCVLWMRKKSKICVFCESAKAYLFHTYLFLVFQDIAHGRPFVLVFLTRIVGHSISQSSFFFRESAFLRFGLVGISPFVSFCFHFEREELLLLPFQNSQKFGLVL